MLFIDWVVVSMINMMKDYLLNVGSKYMPAIQLLPIWTDDSLGKAN